MEGKGDVQMSEQQFGMKESDLEQIMDQYVISEGSGISLENLRYAIQYVVSKNNEAIKESIQEMIDEAVKEKSEK